MLSNEVLEFLLNELAEKHLELKKEAKTDSLALRTFAETIDKLNSDLNKREIELQELKNSNDHQKEITKLKAELKEQKNINRNLIKTNKDLKDKLELFSKMKEIEGEITKKD